MKENNYSYDESLKEFKQSLEGGSEFNMLIDAIIENISTNRIRWFDIGVGDGLYLKKIVRKLEEKGFVVEVTGVDSSRESVEKASKIFPNAEIFHADFLDFEIRGKYDVFSFNQSLYYFHNKNQVIDICRRKLAEGGLMIGVCWSKKDAIYKFHQKVFGNWTIGAFTSEDLCSLFKDHENMNIVYDKTFDGTVNFGMWKNDVSLIKNLNVISRIPLSKGTNYEYYKKATKLIKKEKDSDIRSNGIVISKKSYEIEGLSGENIRKSLCKKFPSYKELVPKIEGDLEALFMGSWEKETEMLADYIPKGKVLEVCCGVGLRSVILGKKHKVVAIDINQDRLNSARKNTITFNVDGNVEFLNMSAEDISKTNKLTDFDAIYIDVDWRENLKHPIKKQNLNPFKTCPRTDKLYKNLRDKFPNIPIIFKVSPFTRVKDMQKLGVCLIEELFIDGKFLSYNVYFDPKFEKSRIQQVHLSNKE